MCNGSKRSTMVPIEGEIGDDESSYSLNYNSSPLLEFSAIDDLEGFRHLVEEKGHDVDEVGLWYGRKFGSNKMAFEERTPLMIASMFGSRRILNYILQNNPVNINRASESDGSTALHCAAAGGSLHAHEVIKLLLDSRADLNRVDANGNRPGDVAVSPCFNSSSKLVTRKLEILLNKIVDHSYQDGSSPKSRKEYPMDPSLPDIKNGVYVTDEFRMFTFKIKPCSRAYSHDWTECPFVHPGENARRRDPRKYHYSCVPCPEFRKESSCPKGDSCEYAHGIFECWLHPAQYRTRLCKDETGCTRRVCFFAHKKVELRPLYASTGSGVPSPWSYGSFDVAPVSPTLNGSPAWASHLRDIDLEAQFRRHQVRPSYSPGMPSSPIRPPPSFGIEQCGSPISNLRVSTFANRSHGFIDTMTIPPHLSDWGSPDGKVDWGVQGDELNKMRKSSSFGVRTNVNPNSAQLIFAEQFYMEQEPLIT